MIGGIGQSRAAAGEIYWTDDDAIRRANLNGMGVEIVVVGLISNQTKERVASNRRGGESNHDTTEAQRSHGTHGHLVKPGAGRTVY